MNISEFVETKIKNDKSHRLLEQYQTNENWEGWLANELGR